MKEEIRTYLIERGTSDQVRDLSDDESLLEAGVIDSMSMVDLIAHLEKTYGIVIDEDDMVPENFDSLKAITAYVGCKQAEGSSAETPSAEES